MVLRDDVDPNRPSVRYGFTPVQEAVWEGSEAVLDVLLRQKDVDVNVNFLNIGDSKPLLSWAAYFGNEGLVRLLLSHEGICPDAKDNDGDTALIIAARHVYASTVKLLLARDDVLANPTDQDGNTPLALAAEWGHAEVVSQLLMRNSIDLDPGTRANEATPLFLAAARGKWNIVDLFLEHGKLKATPMNLVGQASLFPAAARANMDIVKLLLARDEVEVNEKGPYNKTPLFIAAERAF